MTNLASSISSLRFTSAGKASFQTARSKAVAFVSIINVPSTLSNQCESDPILGYLQSTPSLQVCSGSLGVCASAKQACWIAKFRTEWPSLLFKYLYRAVLQDVHNHTSPSTGKERIWACLSFFVIQISMRCSEFSVGHHLCDTAAFYFPWEFVVSS